MTNGEHWGMGLMLGLSAPTSIFIGNHEIPTVISVGYLIPISNMGHADTWLRTLLGFAAGAAKYASQNWVTVRM